MKNKTKSKPKSKEFELYILRHGIAEEKERWHKADSERPLTKEGKKKVAKIAKALKRLDLDLDRILTSPYKRAHQTASIVAKALKMKKEMDIFAELATTGNPDKFIQEMVKNPEGWKAVMVVGHEPYLTHLAGRLCNGAQSLPLNLKKGGLYKVTLDVSRPNPAGVLEWLLPPKLLEKMA